MARKCTLLGLQLCAQSCAGSGCDYDSRNVWTSLPCPSSPVENTPTSTPTSTLPPADWWWGTNGGNCDSVCTAVGLECNAAAMETATTLAHLQQIAATAKTAFADPWPHINQITKLGGGHPANNAPFWDGRWDSHVFPAAGTTNCSVGTPHRWRLCRCGEEHQPQQRVCITFRCSLPLGVSIIFGRHHSWVG